MLSWWSHDNSCLTCNCHVVVCLECFWLLWACKYIQCTDLACHCQDRIFGISFPKNWPLCSPAPGLLLADEAPTWYRNSKQKTKYVEQGHSGLWVQQMVSSGWWRKRVVKHQCLWDSISQQEQLTRLTPIFARLLSPLCGFRGFQHGRSFPRKKSGQDNSQGQASEYFECTRKHYEHGYNRTTMFWNILCSRRLSQNTLKTLMHASRLFVNMQ